MKSQKVTIGLVLTLAIISGFAMRASGSADKKTLPTGLVVGVFDSRAVAIAYAHSEFLNEIMKEKMAEHKKAKKAGDTEKVKELEAWGQAHQEKLHKQGFGTASVKEILKHIKRDIPKVAKEAGVDIIVSKWDMVYQDKNARFVDVTELIIRGYNPPEKALKSIRKLKTYEPFADKDLEGHID